ncbi:helix-turn-helix domain-containing protein [Mangrovimonas futianensis]|uniref:helix-turn-helix domain-containing protein n=1 Tax=Mangrovimonas futianensis TaxID=2895523 RepID=UPI001E3017F6|nr:helix-turn-helix domain-containing protein [Mangrovimonas futianensis]MCF1422877.1 helix-turn-helix domain-containing protein [Mangrovimonas futianensis]
MSSTSFQGTFIEQAEALILEHISNEQFGVSELADLMYMSRSNLLRKIKKETQLSASQFIRQIRLQKAMEMLKETDLTVSEVSYHVGFGNNSYFIKCFRDQYGFSPGELKKGSIDIKKSGNQVEVEEIEPKEYHETTKVPVSRKIKVGGLVLLVTVLVVVLSILFIKNKTEVTPDETDLNIQKSIAVLPFKNMSSDSTNFYFVNGLMESTLSNLQKIEDLRVVSRTSVEKYRNTNKTISEIAEELHVNYVVEGSGQRQGDEVLLHIQLIEAAKDAPVWTEQYNHKVVDVFTLQNDVAKKIADAIKATVTPAELAQIDKIPTKNMEAYDYYLQALGPYQEETKEGLEAAIPLFKKAVEKDPQFALAYSKLAISYYYLDIFQVEKHYTDEINNYADKALLYDSKSAESLIAKALYYIHNKEFRLAVPHLEKALEYNPNSSPVVQLLGDLYSRSIPNTEKYLKYALKGIQLDIAANDSVAKSYIYLHLSNALIQTGFRDEAEKYIELSLEENPQNLYAPYLKVFIEYAKDQNLEKATHALIHEWKKDTSRLDIMQEVAKFYYFGENYDSAYYYYDKFIHQKTIRSLDIYPQENLKISQVYEQLGYKEQADAFYESYVSYCENDQSIYQPASLAMRYIHDGEMELAIDELNKFAAKNHFQYWILLFLEKDPLMKNLQYHPEYEAVIKKIEKRFWENHEQLKQSLKAQNLI